MIRLGLLVILMCCFVSCDEENEKKKTDASTAVTVVQTEQIKEYGAYVHSVYVWLANPESEEERRLFEAAMKDFIKELPFARLFHFGKMIPSERNIVDSSYDYSFIVAFDSEEDMRRHEKDPAHLKFLAETKSLIERIRIYDSRSLLE